MYHRIHIQYATNTEEQGDWATKLVQMSHSKKHAENGDDQVHILSASSDSRVVTVGKKELRVYIQ